MDEVWIVYEECMKSVWEYNQIYRLAPGLKSLAGTIIVPFTYNRGVYIEN